MEAVQERPATDLLLSEAEIVRLTTYTRPAEQLVELHRQGFHRARRSRLGTLIVERAHFEAVMATAGPRTDFSKIIPRPAPTSQAAAAKRVLAEKQRTPPWADQKAILAIYAEAQRLTAETGVPHHVDHDIPLRGKRVSGLHVENNLVVRTAEDNIRKSNRFEVE
jgi:hypothetical protein